MVFQKSIDNFEILNKKCLISVWGTIPLKQKQTRWFLSHVTPTLVIQGDYDMIYI